MELLNLVGRDSIEHELRESIASVHGSAPGLAVLLSGESGAGKTALAEWCLAEAQRSNGFVVVRATCEPFHAGMSFFPIQEINRKLAGPSQTIQQLVAAGYGPTSNELHTATSAFDDEVDPATRRENMMATFANAAIARSRVSQRPVAIFLDDVERIDTPSVDALTVLLSRLNEVQVLLLIAYRSDIVAADRAHTLRPIIDRARRGQSRVHLIDVPALGEADVPSLLGSFLQGASDPPELFVRRLYHETEGNPLHIREVLRALTTASPDGTPPQIAKIGATWKFNQSTDFWDLPQTIEDAIAGRLLPLSTRDRGVLEGAAVVGRLCHFETLSSLTGLDEDDLLTSLDALVQGDLLRESDRTPDSVEFSHGKVRDVVYGQLTGLRRTRLHAQVAEVLIDQQGLLPQDEWDIAVGWHLLKARKYDAATPHLFRAGQRSLADQAGVEASMHFRNALEALEKSNAPDPKKIAETRLKLGESLKLSSQLDAALRELEAVSVSAESSIAQRWALDYIGDIHKMRDHIDRALDSYHGSEALARSANDRELLAKVAADLAELHMREAEGLAGADPEAAAKNEAEYKKYLDMETDFVDESSSREALARSYRNRAKYARAHGDAVGSISLYERSLSFQATGTASHQYLIPYAKALRLVGRSADAMRQVESVLDWSRQIGALRSEAIARQYKGLLLMEQVLTQSSPDAARYERARNEMLRALRLHEETGFRQGYKETCIDLFELELQTGDISAADHYLGYIRPTREDAAASGDRFGSIEAVLAQLTANGERDRALRIRSRLGQLSWPVVNTEERTK